MMCVCVCVCVHVCACLYIQYESYTNTHGQYTAPKVPSEFPAILIPDRPPPSQGLRPTLTLELPEEIHGARIHVFQVTGQMALLLRDFA